MARRIRREARLDARTQLLPARQALNAELRAARTMLRSGTRAERQAARAIIQSARAVRPQVRAGYREAFETAGDANRMLRRDMGGRQNIFSDAIAQETSGFRRRTGEARANELTELAHRELRAADAQVANIRGLRSAFQGTRQEIQAKKHDLAREEQGLIADLINKLREQESDDARDAAKLDLDERKHGLDVKEFRLRRRDTRADNRRADREAAAKGKRGGLTEGQSRDAKAAIATAQSWLLKLQRLGLDGGQARAMLVRGESIPTKQDEKARWKKPDVKVPQIDHRYVQEAWRRNRLTSGLRPW